jgi:hypothetical protein
MALSGSIKTMELPELLQWIGNSAKSGTLTLERDRLTKILGFREGKVVSVESNDPSEHLGQFLLAYGKVDAETLKRAFAMQEKVGLRLGEILIEVNLLKRGDLEDSLRIQAVEILYNLFLWGDEGSFRFDDATVPPTGSFDLELSAVIMEGVYRYDEWRRYREVFPSDDLIVEVDASWKPSSDEEQLAKLIGQGKVIGEICYEFRTSKFHTYSQLFKLYEKRVLKVVSRPAEPVAVAPGVTAVKANLDDLLEVAMDKVRERRYDDALPLLENILRLGKDGDEPRGTVSRAEQTYRDILLTRYIDPHKVPRVVLPPALLTEKRFNAAEGYLISRIDGHWDVASIIRISPIPESEALGIFKRFIDDNIILLT